MTCWTILFAVEAAAEEAGGLFDLDATLPLMAVQFLLLVAALNALFYKPLGRMIDEREGLVRDSITAAEERLSKAKKLAEQYESELASTRRRTQEIVTNAQAEAQQIASQEIAKAQQEAQAQREQVQTELEEQRTSAMATLEGQVNSLSQQILDRLLSV